MKRRLMNFIRVICIIAVFVLALTGLMHLNDLHRAEFPRFYGADAYNSYLPVIAAIVLFLLTPLVSALVGKLCGYRVLESCIAFLRITWGKKVRLTRPGFGTSMLPPRLDGTSPFVLPMLAGPLYLLLLSAVFLLLARLYWASAAVSQLLYLAFVLLALTLVQLLPRKKGSDLLSQVIDRLRSRDLVRAMECTMHITEALSRRQKLLDMPEEWFQTYPASLAEDLYVSNCIINGSSRLIRQLRYAEAYEMLRPLFDLKPAPDTHQIIACAILNGAICEAMAEDESGASLPPMCLSQLEHQSVKYMTPPSWQPRLATAKYARALFITHDEAEAAALLPVIERAVREDQADGTLIQRMQEKAGILPAAEGENA